MPPSYPVPWELLFHISIALVFDQRRSFGEDARSSVAKLNPRLQIFGEENIPPTGPCLVTMNHYSRPGFGAWWMALAVSAALPYEVLWTVTAAWTYHDRLRAQVVTPLTRWLFLRIARVYGFINMPPMPPDPSETMRRAQAVRAVIAYVRKVDRAVIGMAPEGMDFPVGKLGLPPAGAGRFMLHLSNYGMVILPVGVFETDEHLCIQFGPRYHLEVAFDLTNHERDRMASWIVMNHIARLLPANLRGQYDEDQID